MELNQSSEASFAELGLSPYLLSSLAEQGYKTPYPIQQQAIPAILAQQDVLGIAPTGSGKTASYVLPLLMKLSEQAPGNNRHIRALILVPTRELAGQVAAVLRRFEEALPTPIPSLAVFGGVSINPQMKALRGVQVLIATPGRLLDLHRSNAFHLSSVQTLILDEADKLLNLGFQAEMEQIFALLPAKRQNLLFSATLSPEVSRTQSSLLGDPVVIETHPPLFPPEETLIQQVAYFVPAEKKGPFLRQLIQQQDMKQVLVFTSSVYQADLVTQKLRKNDIAARAIHRKKSQGSRTEALSQFKSGNLTVLVATDLLSRGIDIEFLPHVINYELPRSPKDFIHRIGRTGRAEHSGQAISLISPEEEAHFRVIQKKMKQRVPLLDMEDAGFAG